MKKLRTFNRSFIYLIHFSSISFKSK